MAGLKRPPIVVRFVDSMLNYMKVKYGWEYAVPSPLNPDLFPTIDDNNLKTWFKRVPSGRFVCEGMASDQYDKGFRIKELEKEQSDIVYRDWETVFIPQQAWAHALSRAFGRSILILGFNDKPMERWAEPVDWSRARLKWTFALGKPYFDVSEWDFVKETDIPGKTAIVPKTLTITGILDNISNPHPDRFIYMEHPDLLDPSNHGESVMAPIADILFEQRNVTWSIAQGIWRAVTGLINLIYPRTGVDAAAKQQVLGNFSNIHSSVVTSTPDNWKFEVKQLGGPGLASAWKNNEVLQQQLSVGSRVPISVLQGSPRGAFGGSAKEKDMEDYGQTISTQQQQFATPWTRQGLNVMRKTGQLRLLPDKYTIEWFPIYKKSFRDRAADIAGEKMANEIKAILEKGTDEQKFEIMKLFMSTGGLRE